MDNLKDKQPEDIFENIGPKPIIKKENNKERYFPGNPKNPSYEEKPRRESKDIFILITRLLIVLAVIIAIGFAILYFWDEFGNKNVLIENESSTEIANTTSAPAIIEKLKEKPLDTDFDGLSDVEEKQLKTKIDNPDTDNDGLSDREEVKIYFTNPLSSDTDKDGVLDGKEVENGLDPNNAAPGAKLFDLQKEIKALEP